MGNLGIVDARRSIDGIDQTTQAATEYDSECAIGDMNATASSTFSFVMMCSMAPPGQNETMSQSNCLISQMKRVRATKLADPYDQWRPQRDSNPRSSA